MADREKVIKGLECCTQHGSMCGSDCNGHYERYTDDGYVIKLVNEYRSECPYGKCETGCVKTLAKDALELVKEQEPVEVIEDGEVYEGWMSEDERVKCWKVKCWKCNGCGTTVYTGNDKPLLVKYCWNCGKVVKWDAGDRC